MMDVQDGARGQDRETKDLRLEQLTRAGRGLTCFLCGFWDDLDP